MWESRPLPKIVRDPLAALSARGSFFVPAPPGIFWLGKDGIVELSPALVWLLMPAAPLQEDTAWWQADWRSSPSRPPKGR